MTDDSDIPGDATAADEATRRAMAVSAYVDGEAADDEVRLVESDPLLRADADRLRALGDAVSRVAPLGDDRRDALIGTAIAALHDPTRSGAFAPPPAPASRRGSSRWLAVAAAMVAVVAAAGIAVAVIGVNGSDDSNDVASREADLFQDSVQDDDSTGGQTAATDASGDAAAEAPDARSGDTTATAVTASENEADTADERLEIHEITDEQSLVDWVIAVQDDQVTPRIDRSLDCGDGDVLGIATYLDDDVVVVVEVETVIAYDADTCGAVLSADAP